MDHFQANESPHMITSNLVGDFDDSVGLPRRRFSAIRSLGFDAAAIRSELDMTESILASSPVTSKFWPASLSAYLSALFFALYAGSIQHWIPSRHHMHPRLEYRTKLCSERLGAQI